MTADLPPDVRAEAIEAAKGVLWSRDEESAPRVVDAVASVLAAHESREREALSTMLRAMARHATSLRRLTAYAVRRRGEYDQVAADRDQLKARVEVLTGALTELVDIRDDNGEWRGPDEQEVAWDRARAALAAAPAPEEVEVQTMTSPLSPSDADMLRLVTSTPVASEIKVEFEDDAAAPTSDDVLSHREVLEQDMESNPHMYPQLAPEEKS